MDEPDFWQACSPQRPTNRAIRARAIRRRLTVSPRSTHVTRRRIGHSHSIVAGGLLLMSYTTRPTPRTSLIMRLLIVASTS